jgi:hypothetical protein
MITPIEPDADHHSGLRRRLIHSVKMDYRFSLFYMSPDLRKNEPYCFKAAGQSLGYTDLECTEFQHELLKCGLWRKDVDGRIRLRDSFLDLGEMTTHEHIVSAMNVLSRLSEDAACWYETISIVTSLELKKEFYKAINQVIRQFVEKSARIDGDRIVTWTHEALENHQIRTTQTEKKSAN